MVEYRFKNVIQILVGAAVYYLILLLNMRGVEAVLAPLIGGYLASIYASNSKKALAYAFAAWIIAWISIILRYSIVNYNALLRLMAIGYLAYMPIILGLITSLVSGLLAYSVHGMRE